MGLSGVWFSQLTAFNLVKFSDCLGQLNCLVVTEYRWCLNHVVVLGDPANFRYNKINKSGC